MASEDSDELVPGFLPVHRLNDLRDLDQAGGTQVSTTLESIHALDEPLKVASFRRSKPELPEERDDRLHQIVAAVRTTYRFRCSRWLSYRRLTMTCPTPKNSRRSSSTPGSPLTLRHANR